MGREGVFFWDIICAILKTVKLSVTFPSLLERISEPAE